MVIGAFAAAPRSERAGAGIELGMQTGKQVLGQMKDNWDSDRDLTDIKWKCIDINWKHVGASAAIGTVAPGMLSTGKTVVQSAKAIRTLSGQAANTANRAAKLARARPPMPIPSRRPWPPRPPGRRASRSSNAR